MTAELFAALVAFALVSSITPGPNNFMVMASGANFGVRRTLPHIAGVLVGFNIMIWMIGAGLMQVFNAYPQSYLVLKILSAAFLLYLAWKIATAAAPHDGDKAGGKPLTFLQAAAFQWVNPKAWALALAANGAYSSPEAPLFSILIIAVVFIFAGAPSMSSWLLLGTQIRRLLTNETRLRAFNWTCAGLLVATLWPILSAV
jgi:threonine/homoserine/homoserine lactone efflux protein